MAIDVGSEMRRQGKSPKVGLVLGTRRLDVKVAAFESGKRYVVKATCTCADGEVSSFDCSITGPAGEIVATATLTAYQPSNASFP